MKRIRSQRCSWLVVTLLAVTIIAGCDGEGRVEIFQTPPPEVGPQISGQVQLPDGRLAGESRFWRNLREMFAQRAQALFVGNVIPVGAGVRVEATFVEDSNISGGEIGPLEVLASANTNSEGQYQVFLPVGSDLGACRYMVQVGDEGDGTLTRAFVFRPGPVDINFASEATVRSILALLADNPEAELCNFEPDEISALYNTALVAAGDISGDSVEAVNASAEAAAAADPGFQALLEAASLPGPLPATFTPTPTGQVQATATPTPTTPTSGTATATGTFTRAPTQTSTTTPATPTATVTARPSSTPTNTPAGTATSTNTPVSTSVTPPTSTPTPPTVVVSTSTPTLTIAIDTATPTETGAVPTDTVPVATLTPTATIGTGASLDLGTVPGAAGMIVSLPVTLVGTAIVAVSNDIEFDSANLDVVLVNGDPDCEAAPAISGNKQVVASTPQVPGLPVGRKVLRVGVVGTNNNDALPSGVLYSCRFAIAAGAPMGPLVLSNTPDASDASGAPFLISGNDGTINVSAAPPSLDLDIVTGTAGETVTITGTLQSRGQAFSALSSDISIDDTVLDVVLNLDQTPACVADDSIGLGSDLDKEVFAAVLPAGTSLGRAGGSLGVTGPVLRIGLLAKDNNDTLPDGPVFQCQLEIAAGAAAQTVPLPHNAEGSTPDGMSLGLSVGTGQVIVVEP